MCNVLLRVPSYILYLDRPGAARVRVVRAGEATGWIRAGEAMDWTRSGEATDGMAAGVLVSVVDGLLARGVLAVLGVFDLVVGELARLLAAAAGLREPDREADRPVVVLEVRPRLTERPDLELAPERADRPPGEVARRVFRVAEAVRPRLAERDRDRADLPLAPDRADRAPGEAARERGVATVGTGAVDRALRSNVVISVSA